MSWETLPNDEEITLSISGDSILTADPRNSGPIYYAADAKVDPEVLQPGSRVRLRGRGTLEVSARGFQRYRLDENRGIRMKEGK